MFSQYPNLATAGRTIECCPNVQTMPIKATDLDSMIVPLVHLSKLTLDFCVTAFDLG